MRMKCGKKARLNKDEIEDQKTKLKRPASKAEIHEIKKNENKLKIV